LQTQGVQISSEAARAIATRVRELATRVGRPVSVDELHGLLNESAA